MKSDVTRLLNDIGGGLAVAWEQLFQVVYDALRALAGSYFRRLDTGNSLQPTLLVNELYIRLMDPESRQWKSRAHFFAVAAIAMRQILATHAKRRHTAKRGGGWQRVTLGDATTRDRQSDVDIESLDDVLHALVERQARLVEMRCFGNMSVKEIAEVLSISTATVEREWRVARAWLSAELRRGERA